MNKDNAKDYLPLVQALAEGKTIQCNPSKVVGEWYDVAYPEFKHPPECYRIKPEKKKVEVWVNIYPNGEVAVHPISGLLSMPDRIALKKITIEYEEGEGL